MWVDGVGVRVIVEVNHNCLPNSKHICIIPIKKETLACQLVCRLLSIGVHILEGQLTFSHMTLSNALLTSTSNLLLTMLFYT